jgi:hypothetical protein
LNAEPSSMIETRWSASVAWPPHRWHLYESRRSTISRTFARSASCRCAAAHPHVSRVGAAGPAAKHRAAPVPHLCPSGGLVGAAACNRLTRRGCCLSAAGLLLPLSSAPAAVARSLAFHVARAGQCRPCIGGGMSACCDKQRGRGEPRICDDGPRGSVIGGEALRAGQRPSPRLRRPRPHPCFASTSSAARRRSVSRRAQSSAALPERGSATGAVRPVGRGADRRVGVRL